MKKCRLLIFGFLFIFSSLVHSMCRDWETDLQSVKENPNNNQKINEFVIKYIHTLCLAVQLQDIDDELLKKIKLKMLLPLKDYLLDKLKKNREKFAYTSSFFRRYIRKYEHDVPNEQKNYLYVLVKNKGLFKIDLYESSPISEVIEDLNIDNLESISAGNIFHDSVGQLVSIGFRDDVDDVDVKIIINNDFDHDIGLKSTMRQNLISTIVQWARGEIFTNQPATHDNWLKYIYGYCDIVQEEEETVRLCQFSLDEHLGQNISSQYLKSTIYADAKTIVRYLAATNKIKVIQDNVEKELSLAENFPYLKCTVSLDGKRMVLVQPNGTLQLFSLEGDSIGDSLKTKEDAHGNFRKIDMVAFSLYGKFIITGSSSNGEIKLWRVENDQFDEYHSFVIDNWQEGDKFILGYFGLNSELISLFSNFEQLVDGITFTQARTLYKVFYNEILYKWYKSLGKHSWQLLKGQDFARNRLYTQEDVVNWRIIKGNQFLQNNFNLPREIKASHGAWKKLPQITVAAGVGTLVLIIAYKWFMRDVAVDAVEDTVMSKVSEKVNAIIFPEGAYTRVPLFDNNEQLKEAFWKLRQSG